jgi:hypothetical protein
MDKPVKGSTTRLLQVQGRHLEQAKNQTSIGERMERDDDYDEFEDDDDIYCDRCNEFGEVVNCVDDLCHGSGECIHGSMMICPDCKGRGKI